MAHDLASPTWITRPRSATPRIRANLFPRSVRSSLSVGPQWAKQRMFRSTSGSKSTSPRTARRRSKQNLSESSCRSRTASRSPTARRPLRPWSPPSLLRVPRPRSVWQMAIPRQRYVSLVFVHTLMSSLLNSLRSRRKRRRRRRPLRGSQLTSRPSSASEHRRGHSVRSGICNRSRSRPVRYILTT